MSEAQFKDLVAFTEVNGKKRPHTIGYVKIDGGKASYRITALPIGFDGSFIISTRQQNDGTGGAAAKKPTSKRVESGGEDGDDSIPF